MTLLNVVNITKRFGGLIANSEVSFALGQGELLGLIGPNGAGKTTLFNCIAGALRIDAGQIRFKGQDISGKPAHEVARLGIARTFQIAAVSGDLSAVETVMVGCFMRTASRAKAKDRAGWILKELEIADLAPFLVGELPVAAQKRVAMATALGTGPELLLLDEVAAGLNPSEIDTTISAIRHIHRDMGVTVMLIEHVMELVMNLSQRVIVLESGRKIAEGAPEAVAKDPGVIKAYLGARYGAAAAGA